MKLSKNNNLRKLAASKTGVQNVNRTSNAKNKQSPIPCKWGNKCKFNAINNCQRISKKITHDIEVWMVH